jgi:hypothetical protein
MLAAYIDDIDGGDVVDIGYQISSQFARCNDEGLGETVYILLDMCID